MLLITCTLFLIFSICFFLCLRWRRDSDALSEIGIRREEIRSNFYFSYFEIEWRDESASGGPFDVI